MIRVATFNVENLFTRPVAMNQDDETTAREAIEDHAIANRIVSKETYDADDKAKLLELTDKYKWHYLEAPKSALVQMQKIRGQLFRDTRTGPLEVVANGRDAWIGWFELRREDIYWKATFNTGLVLSEVRADIVLCVEVENRATLERFNDQVLRAEFRFSYPHFMVVDGNDQRGIDVGILSRFPITEIRSHVDDPDTKGNRLFSRDCPEYDIMLPSGERLVLIPNHLKSKRNGDDQATQRRREEQAKRAHDIAANALTRSPFVLLGGDLNDIPSSQPLKPLFTDGFEDVQNHPNYPSDRSGTYDTGLASHKLDYLIMSAQLRTRLQDTGIERRGSYHPRTWEPFDTVTKTSEEASDHHLVWADFNFVV
ncbi:MAG: endonuclease/exonuclease/phosphatase family protein [Nitrospira sp.]